MDTCRLNCSQGSWLQRGRGRSQGRWENWRKRSSPPGAGGTDFQDRKLQYLHVPPRGSGKEQKEIWKRKEGVIQNSGIYFILFLFLEAGVSSRGLTILEKVEAVGGTKLLRTWGRLDPELRRRSLEWEGTALRPRGSPERWVGMQSSVSWEARGKVVLEIEGSRVGLGGIHRRLKVWHLPPCGGREGFHGGPSQNVSFPSPSLSKNSAWELKHELLQT